MSFSSFLSFSFLPYLLRCMSVERTYQNRDLHDYINLYVRTLFLNVRTVNNLQPRITGKNNLMH